MCRFRSVLWVIVLLLELRGVELRADEPFRRTLSNEVIGTEWAAPGDTVGFRVTIGGGVPGMLVTIYEQLGSNLSFMGSPPTTHPHFDRYCVISALPVKNLPGADPGAPAENRIACSVMTDDAGMATLALDVQVNRDVLGPTSEATTRDVAAIEDLSTDGIGAVALAQVKLFVTPR